MEGRICFEYRWGLKPVLVYAFCYTKPIFFDFDYHTKRSNTPNNMSSRKRSNTYWSIYTFAPLVAICIARTICHRLSTAICIGWPIHIIAALQRWHVDCSIHIAALVEQTYWSTNTWRAIHIATDGANVLLVDQYVLLRLRDDILFGVLDRLVW